MSRIRTITLSLAALAAAGSALAACSSSGTAAGQTSPPPSPSSPPSSETSSTGTSSAVTSSAPTATKTVTTGNAGSGQTGSGTAGTGQCAETQLRASVVPDDIPGLNRHVVKLVFKNTSSSTCTLYGFPGAAIEDSANQQVAQAKRVAGGPVGGSIEQSYKQRGPLPLKPGTSVFAYLEGQSTREVGAAQAGCDGPKNPRILVTPPNTRTPVPFSIGWPLCYSFNVHPVREQ